MAGNSAAFKALADENRMLILRLLLRRNCCVRALSRQLDISEAAVSQHLKVLREAGLILGEKSGYFTHYTVNRSALQALADALSAMARAAECVPCTPLHGGCSAAEFEKCRNAAKAMQPTGENGQINWKGNRDMKIAVTYQNGQIFQHFGHTEKFKVYQVEDGKVVSSAILSANGVGHGALAGLLRDSGADTLICGGIGGGAQMALAQAGIRLYGGVSGSADQAVEDLLAGKLDYDPDVKCDHHDHAHGEGHQCGHHHGGDHGCGGRHGEGHSCC